MSTIKFGIDLGTTNSAITAFEEGEARVKRNGLQMDTTPSCVSYDKRGNVRVGFSARAQQAKDYAIAFIRDDYKPNTYIEFKRLMGTDHTYPCPNLGRDLTPEDLSAEVLKALRKNILEENVNAAVITVPAMFTNTQKDATKRAAHLAGIDRVELIQEPVAASIAYGLGGKGGDGYWVVFDFGGGTFDAALMTNEGGIIRPIDTAGNNKLGGKDIDRALFDDILLPYFLNNYTLDETLSTRRESFANMWKPMIEEAKISLSTNPEATLMTDLGDNYGTDDRGEELAIDLTITQQDLLRIATPIYQRAIDITLALLERNHVRGADLAALILVGGPTHSPIVRDMLRQQVTQNVDTRIDPMTCVAQGAAIYGMTIADTPDTTPAQPAQPGTLQLDITYEHTSVQEEEYVTVKCLGGRTASIEFARRDGLFTSPQVSVGADDEIVTLPLAEGKANTFEVRAYDRRGSRLKCEPTEIVILQGLVPNPPILPMAIGINTCNDKGIEVFTPLEGLEKNRALPAEGHTPTLYTPADMRPGVAEDDISIQFYQLDDVRPDTRVLFCHRISDAKFSGDDLPRLLPKGSPISLRCHAEPSGTLDRVEVVIPSLNLTIDLTQRVTSGTTSLPSAEFLSHEFEEARVEARKLDCSEALLNRLSALQQQYAASPDDRDTADLALAELQTIRRDIDQQHDGDAWQIEWRRVEGMCKELEGDQAKYGNAESQRLIDGLKQEMKRIEATHDPDLASELYDRLWNLDFKIATVEFYDCWIYNWDQEYDQKLWRDRQRARQLIDQGRTIMNRNHTAADLQPIVDGLFALLPEHERKRVLHK